MSAIVITLITPTQGSANILVTINGSGFTGETEVRFGSDVALSTFFTDSKVTAISPPGLGTVLVTVRTVDQVSNGFPFTYLDLPIIVANLSPNSGPEAGGTLVTINGSGFTSETEVRFGSNVALSTFFTDSKINAISPPGTGTIDVTLMTANSSASQQFTYLATPVLDSLSPTSGPSSGGTSVSLFGSGFTGASSVTFGDQQAAFIVISDTQIDVLSPTGVGSVPVTVTTPGGQSNSLLFTFILPCLSSYTQVLMADGSSKEIQKIVRGDLVAGDPGLRTTYVVARILIDKVSAQDQIDVVTFEQNCLGSNLPNQKLIITANHALLWEMARRPAKCFINYQNVKRENSYASNLLPANENGRYYVYDLQFETLGNFVANGITVQSRAPRSNLTPLPQMLYFHHELYRPETDVDDPEYELPLDLTTL